MYRSDKYCASLAIIDVPAQFHFITFSFRMKQYRWWTDGSFLFIKDADFYFIKQSSGLSSVYPSLHEDTRQLFFSVEMFHEVQIPVEGIVYQLAFFISVNHLDDKYFILEVICVCQDKVSFLWNVNPGYERELLEEWIVLSWVLFRVADLTEPGLDQHQRAVFFFPREHYPPDLSLTPCSAVIRTTATIVLMTLDCMIMNISYQYHLSHWETASEMKARINCYFISFLLRSSNSRTV